MSRRDGGSAVTARGRTGAGDVGRAGSGRSAGPEGSALVTGAAGFIGSHLTRRLASGGWRVTGLDLHGRPREVPDGVRWVQGDLRDAARVDEALAEVDVVFHLASVHLAVGVPEAEFRAVNVDAAARLVHAAAERGARRFVHTSSVGIYGDVREPPADELSPPNPENAYERTKLEGERAVRRRAEERDLDLVVLRPAWAYGPGCPRTDRLLRAVAGGRFLYFGDGGNLRHPVFIEDVLDAYVLAAAPGAPADGRAYIIAGPRYMPLREMVEAFARAVGAPPPRRSVPVPVGWMAGLAAEAVGKLTRRDPPISRRTLAFFTHDNAYSTEAARRELGFRPAVDLEEGLARTLARAGRDLPEPQHA